MNCFENHCTNFYSRERELGRISAADQMHLIIQNLDVKIYIV